MTLTAPPRPAAPAAPLHPAVPPAPPQAPPAEAAIYLVPTLIGAAAVLGGSSALTAAVSGSSWVLPLLEVVGVVWLVGVGGRLIRVPAAGTVVLQLLGLAIALTSLFTTGGIGGVLPNAEVVREFGALLSGAWQQILVTAPPAPSTPELSFLIALAVGAAAIIVDFLIAEAHAPALVALPLLCLYSVPASIATTMLPWPTFAAPAALYALLLAVSGHPGRRRGARVGVGLAASGIAITVVATLLAILVADAVTTVGTSGRLPRTATGAGEIGLSPFTSLHGNLQRSDPVNLLEVSGATAQDYLREVALEVWTPGQGWSAGELVADVSGVNGQINGAAPGADPVQVSIRSLQLKDKFLPVYAGTSAVTGLRPGWNYDRQLGTVFRADSQNPQTYALTASFAKVSEDALRKDTVTPGGTLTDTGSLPRRVTQLAQDVTQGKGNAFDKADALRTWFTDPENGFRYSLNVPTGNTGDALTDFLDNKQGYCEQFASAMAIMLRAIGIPARVAVGYTQGTPQDDGSALITSHDAHAWVEVLFDTNGWVRFDPTPLAGSSGGVQGFAENTEPKTTTTDVTETTDTSTDVGTVLPGGSRAPDGDLTTARTAAALPQSGTDSGVPAILWWLLGILAGIALITAAPSLIRGARRRRRLGVVARGGPGSAAAAWAELEDLCLDHGITLRTSESARATANRLARVAYLGDEARVKLRSLVVAAEQEWYGSAAADVDGGDGGADLVAAVQAVEAGLNRSTPLSLPDRMLPRSVRPSARD